MWHLGRAARPMSQGAVRPSLHVTLTEKVASDSNGRGKATQDDGVTKAAQF